MSGWHVSVDPRSPEERDSSEDKKSTLVASWDDYSCNTLFLDDLVAQGKAEKLRSGGYPSRFVVRASDLVPLIIDGPPAQRGRNYEVTIHRDRLADLAPGHLLTVDMWDVT